MNGIRAVGFDLDGTFMNTRVDYVRLNSTDRTVCISHGVPFDEIDFGDSPKRLREPIRRWMEDNGRGSEYPELSREIDDALTECECEFADEATPFPGSVECLGRLRDMGYRTGLLTRGSLAYAKRVRGSWDLCSTSSTPSWEGTTAATTTPSPPPSPWWSSRNSSV